MTSGREAFAVLVGPRVSYVFRIKDGRVEVPGTLCESRGLIPEPDALGLDGQQPAWVVSAAGTPRVSVDGRSTINPEAIRLTADAATRAGARLSGPLPSEAVAADLFPHELARQTPDVLVLTQTIAGDKSRALARALERGVLTPAALPIIYNGPGGYSHPEFNDAGACSLVTIDTVFSGGKANPAPTREALAAAVREHLAAKLAEAGFGGGVPFSAAGPAAVRAVKWLAEWSAGVAPESASGGARGRNGRNGNGSNGVAGQADVCLVVAELDRASAFALSGERLETGTVEFMGTGTIDLTGPERLRPANSGSEGWLPAWETMAERLPFQVDLSDLANMTGNALVRPWALPGGLAEACLGDALVEELLARLAARWRNAAGKEAFDLSRTRLLAGTGFGLGRLGDTRLAAHALVNAFQPLGISTVVIDPHGTLLLEAGAMEAGLPWPTEFTPPEVTAVCVSPLKATFDWRRATTDPWAVVTVEREDGHVIPRRLVPGSVGSIPIGPGQRAILTVEPCTSSIDFGAGPGRVWKGWISGGAAGVILDGRGRPVQPPKDTSFRVTKQREFLAAFGVFGKEDFKA